MVLPDPGALLRRLCAHHNGLGRGPSEWEGRLAPGVAHVAVTLQCVKLAGQERLVREAEGRRLRMSEPKPDCLAVSLNGVKVGPTRIRPQCQARISSAHLRRKPTHPTRLERQALRGTATRGHRSRPHRRTLPLVEFAKFTYGPVRDSVD